MSTPDSAETPATTPDVDLLAFLPSTEDVWGEPPPAPATVHRGAEVQAGEPEDDPIGTIRLFPRWQDEYHDRQLAIRWAPNYRNLKGEPYPWLVLDSECPQLLSDDSVRGCQVLPWATAAVELGLPQPAPSPVSEDQEQRVHHVAKAIRDAYERLPDGTAPAFTEVHEWADEARAAITAMQEVRP